MKELTYTEEVKCAAIHALRINVKSLAMESKYNRQETSKIKNHFVKSYLNEHRVHKLREEARITQLALAAVRGEPYILIEQKTKHPPNFDKVSAKARKYIWFGPDKKKIAQWIANAKLEIEFAKKSA